MFEIRMDTPGIPERVFVLCKLVEKKPTESSELKEKMEPGYIERERSTSYFAYYRDVAKELELISIRDDIVSLSVDSSVIKDMHSMKQYIIKKISSYEEGPFYQISKKYFRLGDKILFKKEQNITQIPELLSMTDDKGLRGWRFWAEYLGLGYMQGMFFIPNAAEFVKVLIEQSELKKNQLYTVKEFINHLRPQIDLIMNFYDNSRRINFGTSNALKTLEDLKVIKLENILDEKEVWNLYQYSDAIPARITHITVL